MCSLCEPCPVQPQVMLTVLFRCWKVSLVFMIMFASIFSLLNQYFHFYYYYTLCLSSIMLPSGINIVWWISFLLKDRDSGWLCHLSLLVLYNGIFSCFAQLFIWPLFGRLIIFEILWTGAFSELSLNKKTPHKQSREEDAWLAGHRFQCLKNDE